MTRREHRLTRKLLREVAVRAYTHQLLLHEVVVRAYADRLLRRVLRVVRNDEGLSTSLVRAIEKHLGRT